MNAAPLSPADTTPSVNDVPHLVAAVYEAAPPALRPRLIEQMLRPLSLLSVAAVADGMFASIGLRSRWAQMPLQPDDVQNVQSQDVAALAGYLQQLGMQAFDGVGELLAGSPTRMGTTATVVLLALLAKHYQRTRVSCDEDFDPP